MWTSPFDGILGQYVLTARSTYHDNRRASASPFRTVFDRFCSHGEDSRREGKKKAGGPGGGSPPAKPLTGVSEGALAPQLKTRGSGGQRPQPKVFGFLFLFLKQIEKLKRITVSHTQIFIISYFQIFRHRVTRQTKSVIFRSKDRVQIRRSKRLANDTYGTKRIRVPILVAQPQQQPK